MEMTNTFNPTQEQLDTQLPSDFLIDNFKTLQKRNDFEDMVEQLDELHFEATQQAYQDGVLQGEISVLRQFVDGKLDLQYVKEYLEDYEREVEDNTFRLNDAVTTKHTDDFGVITKLLPNDKALVTWCCGSIHESTTNELICELIKA